MNSASSPDFVGSKLLVSRGLQICKPTWNIWIQIHGWSSVTGVAMPGHVHAGKCLG